MKKAILAKRVVFLPPVDEMKDLNDYISAEAGTSVLEMGRTSADAVRIYYKGRTAWVHKNYLKEVKEIE